MTFSLFTVLAATFKRFNEDRCWNFAVIISYFTLLCAIPVIALFAFVTAKVLGSSELAFRSLNLFTEEFFAQFDPAFFQKIRSLSGELSNLGWFGLAGSFIAASFLFSNLVYAINFIFKANFRKSFFYSRLLEYIIMFTIGIIMLISLSITAIWTAINRSINESTLVVTYINPRMISLINNFLIQYFIPFALTFLVLFSLYKLIPEVKVYTSVAVVSAAVSAFLWEVFKRIFAFYVAHFSAVGIVLSRLLQGTLTSMIFFLLWITFSLVILLWGAELAAVLNERKRFKHEQAA